MFKTFMKFFIIIFILFFSFFLQTNDIVIGDNDWYQSTLREKCVQEALNNYLADYPYLDGYNPSQIDTKVYQIFIKLDNDFTNYPHLRRWYKHIASYNNQEKSMFHAEKGKILSQCGCKIHDHNRKKQVNYIDLLIIINDLLINQS